MSDFTLEHVQEFFSEDYDGDKFPDGISEFFYELTEGGTFEITLNDQPYEARVIQKFDDGNSWTNKKHLVFEVEGRFFKFPGVFYSHDGDYWDADQISEVIPKRREVIIYE